MKHITQAENAVAGWENLSADKRADLLAAGVPHPAETSEERRCRVKRALGLFDDQDLEALTGSTQDTLTRHRVKGTGPRPSRVLRSVFYSADDVRDWILRHRDAETISPR